MSPASSSSENNNKSNGGDDDNETAKKISGNIKVLFGGIPRKAWVISGFLLVLLIAGPLIAVAVPVLPFFFAFVVLSSIAARQLLFDTVSSDDKSKSNKKD
jgi:VIT1/CCC1 family predicted Fe2+/Mn2+ transporter